MSVPKLWPHMLNILLVVTCVNTRQSPSWTQGTSVYVNKQAPTTLPISFVQFFPYSNNSTPKTKAKTESECVCVSSPAQRQSSVTEVTFPLSPLRLLTSPDLLHTLINFANFFFLSMISPPRLVTTHLPTFTEGNNFLDIFPARCKIFSLLTV